MSDSGKIKGTSQKSVVTRFPPSPTGFLHIGRARTALFNSLFAKQNGGRMIFRVEDTDKERSKKEFEQNIIDCLKWLGIGYDEGPYRQSERGDRYISYLQKLIDTGHAYISKEAPKEAPEDAANAADTADGSTQRSEVIRFKNPNKTITFTDLIRGEISFDTTDLKDFVIAKSLTKPLYHLAVVVDDHEMGVTHVIRGEDGISNTPRQILIQEAIGASRPIYAHIPLILAPDKSKLSGRHGAVAVTDYRKEGYLPEAVINFLALLGWNPGTDQEIFSMDELIAAFDLAKVQKSGAVFNIDKLTWFNRQYILKLSDADLSAHAAGFLPEWLSVSSPTFKRLMPVIKDKISTFGEIASLFGPDGELRFMKGAPEYPAEMLLWKKEPDKAAALTHLQECRALIERLSDGAGSDATSFTAEAVKASVWPYAEAHGKGNVLWPLRVALTGQERSPDPFVSAALLGREESLKRIDAALTRVRG